MRKTLLSLFLLCFVCLIQAQQSLPSLNYIPQGPTTAAFTRYGDIPVDLSTGVTNISIPIFTLNEHGINIPVSISYHASGIKVSDVASPVGLGWTLNAGGIITRTVFGLKDEQLDWAAPDGHHTFWKPPFRTIQQFLDYNSARELQDQMGWADELFNQMINVAPGHGQNDFYSDRFFYNLGNGESGVFRKDYVTEEFKTIPYRPMKIRFMNTDQIYKGFEIEMTTDDGTRYLFERNKYDVWHPEKIYNSSNNDSVVFYTHADTIETISFTDYEEFGSYNNTPYPKTEPWIESGTYDLPGTWCRLRERENNNTSGIYHNGVIVDDEIVLVDSIVGPNTVIRFTYAKDRVDATVITAEILSRLTNIQVVNRANGALIKNVDLSQTYSGETSRAKRLMLAGIQTGASGEEKYAFKYNPLPLPEYYMTAYQSTDEVYMQDFWGYYNDSYSYSTLFRDFSPNGALNLFPDEMRTQACMLQEIKYPTGGKSVFEYENHRVPPYFYGPGLSPTDVSKKGIVGGLRIKKISTYAYEGAIPQVKTYEYVCELPKYYGYLDYDKFTYRQETFNYFDHLSAGCVNVNVSDTWNQTFSNICVERSMGRYIGGPQAPVYYNKVTEYNGDGSSNAGKTVYYFHLPSDILNDDVASSEFRYCGPWDKDLGSYTPTLEKKEEYKNQNGQYKLVHKTETEYTRLHGETFYTGFTLTSELRFNPMTGNAQDAFYFYNRGLGEWYFPTLHYDNPVAYPGLDLPWKTNVYDYVDSINFTKTYTEYSYNQLGQQISVNTTTSKGDALITKLTYPVDYAAQPPYNTMVARNIIAPVIEQSTYKNTNSTGDIFLQSTKTNYNYWNYAAQTWGNDVSNQILPQTVDTKKGANPAETRVRYYWYDDKNNPVYVSKENDTRQLFLWGYNKTYPVAQVINITEDQRPYVTYSSFETGADYGVWAGTIVDDNTAPTGKRCLRLNSGGQLDYPLNAAASYILSYWYKVGGSIEVIANSPVLVTSQPKNGWIYEKRKITGIGLLSIRGPNSYIDEVRLYPESAQMTTYSYEPGIGTTAQCDVNDRITHYTYDASGRLVLVKDEDGNILKKICYNFQGQPDACGESALALWQTTGATRSAPCPQNPAYLITQGEERDNNPNSDSYGTTRWVDKEVGLCYASAEPVWKATYVTRCKPCPQNTKYFTNSTQTEEKDINPNSTTWNTSRWIDLGVIGTCFAPGGWEPTGNLRCRTVGGQITGEQEREMKDMNFCSATGGMLSWDNIGMNVAACPLPPVFQSLDVSGNYFKQSCGSQQMPLPYYVSMPQGSYTSTVNIQDATNQATAEAQRLANVNGQCKTVYVRVRKVLESDPSDYQQYTNYIVSFYSDAAGTIPYTIQSTLVINIKVNAYWIVDGQYEPEGDSYYSLNAYANDNTWEYEAESTFCPYSGSCRHEEMTLLSGQYVIIP
ncbi:hypothetical protein A4H97_18760 [Niastella yeongjuensis]|uniref:DUF5977 domain-containing protein n=1 Tax=Niastella yeongjuensis TaxID=354355 RepID=A0A1V9DY43_9BACT|nr:RHS repeat domain-containing protein [Niastella yeongjuensis]OQP38760.1 hypothetical protein A4H97_18760 [Niastella yeongjuensis]SEO33633.1 YD repeat-containing protein [Niastella yeongjuensis]